MARSATDVTTWTLARVTGERLRRRAPVRGDSAPADRRPRQLPAYAAAVNSARVTTMAMPNSSVAMPTRQRIRQRLGKARNAGRPRHRDDLRLDRHGAAVGAARDWLRSGPAAARARRASTWRRPRADAAAPRRRRCRPPASSSARGSGARRPRARRRWTALFSMPSTILPTSLLIWRCRPSRSARSWRMRGCAGSSVADSSESCRSTRTRCCTRFWMSGERCTSGSALGVAGTDHLAHRLRAGIRLAARRLRLGQLGRDVAELLLVETRCCWGRP